MRAITVHFIFIAVKYFIHFVSLSSFTRMCFCWDDFLHNLIVLFQFITDDNNFIRIHSNQIQSPHVVKMFPYTGENRPCKKTKNLRQPGGRPQSWAFKNYWAFIFLFHLVLRMNATYIFYSVVLSVCVAMTSVKVICKVIVMQRTRLSFHYYS